MRTYYRDSPRLLLLLFSGVVLLAQSISFAQSPITPSGLNTQISGPIEVGGQTQFNITGGTRPGGGPNVFHSFGNFNVPTNNIANFLNTPVNGVLPATSNILGRVTGGNPSNIFGMIQTTGFGNANLFVMNPAGIVFGPNASLNVGGSVSFTTADYLRLADGARFAATPGPTDASLSSAPVAAFGFLGSNPGAITVQGGHLSVADEAAISLVGGNITVQGGTLTAPTGQINLVSVGRSSKPNVAGEVVVTGPGERAGFNPMGFKNLGTVSLAHGSTLDASVPSTGQLRAERTGSVVIRGGQFVMEEASIKATAGGTVDATADQIRLSNHSVIDTSITLPVPLSPGHVTFNAKTFSATDSAILTNRTGGGIGLIGDAGPVTIQGRQGTGTSANTISLVHTEVVTGANGAGGGGQILLRAENIALNNSTLSVFGARAAPIRLVSGRLLDIQNSMFNVGSFLSSPGTVDLSAGKSITVTNTNILGSSETVGGSVIMSAPVISLRGSRVSVGGDNPAGSIRLVGTKAVNLADGTQLQISGSGRDGGAIEIDGGAQFTSQQSTISARARGGDSIKVDLRANKVEMTDTQVTLSTFSGPGGTITLDAKDTTLTNSQILSTARDGVSGPIDITSPSLRLNAGSVIDSTSQLGTDGTVTINGVIQP